MNNSLFTVNSINVGNNTKIEIYSTELCPYCTRARMLLDSKGVDYVEFRVDRDRNLRHEMEQRSRRTSVPQIFIDEKHIGGFTELAELEIIEELDDMLGIRQHN